MNDIEAACMDDGEEKREDQHVSHSQNPGPFLHRLAQNELLTDAYDSLDESLAQQSADGSDRALYS